VGVEATPPFSLSVCLLPLHRLMRCCRSFIAARSELGEIPEWPFVSGTSKSVEEHRDCVEQACWGGQGYPCCC
jgi:hypothetical protein